jgi:hypothetical protein
VPFKLAQQQFQRSPLLLKREGFVELIVLFGWAIYDSKFNAFENENGAT